MLTEHRWVSLALNPSYAGFWEHLIRDEGDFKAHMDYVHFNPVKHGHVTRVADWPYSTFHRLVAQGVYPPDWAGSAAADELDGLD